MSIGIVKHGAIGKKWYWETQLFARIREFSDGITFFRFNLNWDRYESEHSPAFQITLTLFNLYFHLWIYSCNQLDETEINTDGQN